ncbi:hypothetical protein B7463_g8471, partial [Scytalidium lignicola]
MNPGIVDNVGHNISVGDHVSIKIRGGHREGDVEKIVETEKEAEEEGVKHPPKVIFHDQHGDRVAHNPESLTVTEKQ